MFLFIYIYYKNAIRENPGNQVRCPSDREKRLETRKKKVRRQQVGVIDSTAVRALFPQLVVVVSVPYDALSMTCAWNILRRI